MLEKPVMESGGGGLVSTTMDYARFCQMLLNGGTLDGNRIIGRKTLELMASDHLGAERQGRLAADAAPVTVLDSASRSAPHSGMAPFPGSVGQFFWSGMAGTFFFIDPAEDLFAVFMMQGPGQREYIRNVLRRPGVRRGGVRLARRSPAQHAVHAPRSPGPIYRDRIAMRSRLARCSATAMTASQDTQAQLIVAPPSITMVWPVMKSPAFEPINTAAPAISSGMPMRSSGERAVEAFSVLRIVPQRLGEVGLDQAGRDAVHADIVLAVFAGEVARELHVGGLRDRVGAEHGRALQAADRGHDDDRAVLALDHLRHHHADQPVVGDDVVVEDLAELIVGNAGERTVIGIGRGVADQHVDLAEGAVGFVDQVLQIFLAGNVGGDRDRRALAELVVDLLGDLIADVLLARGDHDLGAVLGHPLRDGAADAARSSR